MSGTETSRPDDSELRNPIDLLYPFYLDTDMSMAFAAAITGGVSLEEEQIDQLSDGACQAQ